MENKRNVNNATESDFDPRVLVDMGTTAAGSNPSTKPQLDPNVEGAAHDLHIHNY